MRLKDIIKVRFVDINPEIISALTKGEGRELSDCEFVIGDILKQDYGSLVSPSNCYGNMDGGIDKSYALYFLGLEERLKKHIEEFHAGKLEIGSAQMVPTGHERFPYVVFSPTIEHPGDIAESKNIWKAMVASLRETVLYNLTMEENGRPDDKIEYLLVPGLGTGYGGLEPEIAAKEIRRGYAFIDKKISSVFEEFLSQTDSGKNFKYIIDT